MSTIADAFIEPEAMYRAQVMHATWGHLEAKRGTTHKGWFAFTIAAYGGVYAILGSDWGDLDDSPGLYTAMHDYMGRHAKRGVVMCLDGHVTRFKNGSYRIGGKRRVVRLKPSKPARNWRY